MYSPFHQLRKPANQQNMENASQFPAHLVPGTFYILHKSCFKYQNNQLPRKYQIIIMYVAFQAGLLQQLQ